MMRYKEVASNGLFRYKISFEGVGSLDYKYCIQCMHYIYMSLNKTQYSSNKLNHSTH